MSDNLPKESKSKWFKHLNSNTFIGVTALIVSVCALAISFQESQTLRIQQKAMVYPHVVINQSYNSEGFRVKVVNSGTGLAMINSLKISYAGQEFDNWIEVADRFLPEGHQVNYSIINASEVEKQIIPAERTVVIFGVPWNDETRMLVDSLYKLEYKLCYCSILQDCWKVTKLVDIPQRSDCGTPMLQID